MSSKAALCECLLMINVKNFNYRNFRGQLNKRRGIITGSDGAEGWTTIYAEVPLNDMFGYAGEIRSSTQGKGEFSMEYSRYSPCSQELQQRLVEDYQRSMGLLPDEKKKKKN